VRRFTFHALCVVALYLAWAPACLAVEGLLTDESKQAPVKAGGTPTELADLRDKRAKAQAELKTISSPETIGADAPPNAPQEELLERRALLHQIVRSYDEQIDDSQRLEQARRRNAEQAGDDAKELAEPPPYSIFLGDHLWDAVFSLRLAVEGLESQLSLIQLRFDRARDSLSTAEERLRQASERLEAGRDSPDAARRRWVRDLEELRKRAAAAMVGAAELSQTRVQEELAETRARLESSQRRLETVQPHLEFTQDDLRKVQAGLSQERQQLAGQLEQTAAERTTQSGALRDSERQLAARLTKRTSKEASGRPPESLRRAEEAVELKRLSVDNLALKGDLLQLLLDIVEGERQLWDSRFSLAHSTEAGKAREAYIRFTPLFNNFRASRDYLRQQVGVVSGQISELENRLGNTSGERRAHVQALLQGHRQRVEIYDRALQRMDRASRFLERWKSEFKEQGKGLPLSARLQDWFERAWTAVKTAWNFEVFTAEDTIEVEGKTITGRRSVTVGKIVSALGILLIGYWICLYLAGLIGRLAVTRLGMTPELANLVRQWSQAVLLTILIVVSLVSVKIPLTIFAFLGGAFAIGAGFGAQNLLKNVISGVLLLIERPLRVGDLIEVENVRGRVTTIGLRSSTVRDAKGMETLIPNSSFLERHLTNWTYSSRISRFSLRIGIPYGSPTQQIMKLLADLAQEHPHVLKIPRPQVLLEEFGAQARIFTLNYWLEIRLDVDPSEVASELRFALEKKFTEAGLKILPAA